MSGKLSVIIFFHTNISLAFKNISSSLGRKSFNDNSGFPNVINHLSLSDEELESCVTSFVKMVDEVCTGMSQNEVAVFLIVLAHALSEYSSIKSETLDNIQINIDYIELQ